MEDFYKVKIGTNPGLKFELSDPTTTVKEPYELDI